jgi:O-antigen ligase
MSLSYIKENIIGYGAGYFSYLTDGVHKYPHNIFIEILLEFGIQGLMLIGIGIIISIKRYYYYLKKYKDSDYILYLNFSFSILVFAIINAQFSGDIISNEYIWFGFIMIGKFGEIINEYLSEI